MMRMGITVGAAALALAMAAEAAHAFCGFYVNGSGAKLSNDATQVVLMRQGTRTVLSMQNDYKGPLEDFAMVVPVPVVLKKEDVKTLPKAVIERVDSLGAPRLVEYWEQDPCPSPDDMYDGDATMARARRPMPAKAAGMAMEKDKKETVKIEAQFEVGE